MNCPICKSDTLVLRKDGADRRRECTACRHRFTTSEVQKDELDRLQEVQRDARALAEKLTA